MNKSLFTLTGMFIALSAMVLTGCEKEDKDAISMSDVNKGIQVIQGADGKDYEVVDLGLVSGNLWAKCNLGATSPEQTGSFFAWAETAPKTMFKWVEYKWADGDRLSITKYNNNEENGLVDDKTVLDISDDAANAILGEGWQVPNVDDFLELLAPRNCKIKWCKLNGVEGFLFTSVKKGYEGNSIFIAVSGMSDNGKLRFKDERAYLWSSEMYYDDLNQKYIPTTASVLELEHTDVDNHVIGSRERYLGLPIRPVFHPEQ